MVARLRKVAVALRSVEVSYQSFPAAVDSDDAVAVAVASAVVVVAAGKISTSAPQLA